MTSFARFVSLSQHHTEEEEEKVEGEGGEGVVEVGQPRR